MPESAARPGRRRGVRAVLARVGLWHTGSRQAAALARVGLCVLTLLSAAGCAASPSRPAVEQQPASQAGDARPPTRLAVAYTSVGLTQAYLWIAQEAGYFSDEGLAVELHY